MRCIVVSHIAHIPIFFFFFFALFMQHNTTEFCLPFQMAKLKEKNKPRKKRKGSILER